MAGKKGTTRKSSSKKATKKSTKKSLEKLEKNTGNQDTKKKGTHGGKREGAGRKPSEDRERLNTMKDMAEIHALEEVQASIIVDGKAQSYKATRHQVLLDVLFDEGMSKRNITAIKEYFDRTRGKSVQPVEHGGEIKTEDQYLPDDPATIAAHEAYKKERKKLIAQGYYGDESEE